MTEKLYYTTIYCKTIADNPQEALQIALSQVADGSAHAEIEVEGVPIEDGLISELLPSPPLAAVIQQIQAIDDKLTATEESPNGETYNQVFELLRPYLPEKTT